MTTSTLPRTQVLVRGANAWRITKFNDAHFVAKNNRGVTHTYDNEYKCNRFWDFLESVGFKLREDAWSLKTLVCHTVATPSTSVIEDDEVPADLAAFRLERDNYALQYGVDSNNADWRDAMNAAK